MFLFCFCLSRNKFVAFQRELANRNAHCISFVSQALPMDANVYERLDKLEMLGGEAAEESIIIPVVNVSNNDEMTTAVYEVLEEQGIFEDISDDGITWTDCPLVTVDIKTFDSNDELPYDAPIAIALCESEDDYIRLHTLMRMSSLLFSKTQRVTLLPLRLYSLKHRPMLPLVLPQKKVQRCIPSRL